MNTSTRHSRQRQQLASAVIVMLLLLPSLSWAQVAAEDRNGIYLEVLGSGGLFSVNYEREVANGLRARIGFASWTASSFWSEAERSMTTVPMTVTQSIGRGAHQLEVGGGVTVGRRERSPFDTGSEGFVSLTGLLGYRFDRPGRGFLFRAGLTPFYGFGDEVQAYPEKGLFPSFGISFGYSF